jgi:hypothetical protein
MQFTMQKSIAIGKILVCLFMFSTLISCGNKETSPNLQRDNLMKLIFKELKTEGNYTAVPAKYLKINDEYSHGEDMRVQSLQVVRLSDTRAIMLVKVAPISPGHSSQALLAAYWFKLADKKWFLDVRQDEVEWLGSSGDYGNTTVLELYPKHYALLVEYRWAGMGEDNTWANLYQLGDQKVTSLFGPDVDFMLAKSYGLGNECDDSDVNAPIPKLHITVYERDPEPNKCFNIKTKWQLKQGKSAPGDFVLESVAKVSIYKETSRTTPDDPMNIEIMYQFNSTTERGTQVFQYDAAKGIYKRASGKSPLPAWYGG